MKQKNPHRFKSFISDEGTLKDVMRVNPRINNFDPVYNTQYFKVWGYEKMNYFYHTPYFDRQITFYRIS